MQRRPCTPRALQAPLGGRIAQAFVSFAAQGLGLYTVGISDSITLLLESRPDLSNTITSLGLPILSADGENLTRGPFIRIPELAGGTTVAMGRTDRDTWAEKGWIDLRPNNFAVWQERFTAMRAARGGKALRGSAAVSQDAYVFEDIQIGTVVAWILTNEHDGFRIK